MTKVLWAVVLLFVSSSLSISQTLDDTEKEQNFELFYFVEDEEIKNFIEERHNQLKTKLASRLTEVGSYDGIVFVVWDNIINNGVVDFAAFSFSDELPPLLVALKGSDVGNNNHCLITLIQDSRNVLSVVLVADPKNWGNSYAMGCILATYVVALGADETEILNWTIEEVENFLTQ